MRAFCLIATLVLARILNAGVIEFDELINKPSGNAKDYYIYRLLKSKEVSKEQAQILNKELSRKSNLIEKLLAKILPPTPQKPSECDGIKLGEILKASPECQAKLSTIQRALKLSPQTREQIAKNIADKFPKKAQTLLGLNEPSPSLFYANNGYTASFLSLFNTLDEESKSKEFMQEYPKEFMQAFYSQNGFRALLTSLTTQQIMTEFRANFLKISPETTAKDSAFMLGVNALSLGQKEIALEFFAQAAKTYEAGFSQDNALFWVYKLGDNENALKSLAKSSNLNIYSLLAKELTEADEFEIIVPKPELKFIQGFNEKDPFAWQELKAKAKGLNKYELEKLANNFYSNATLGAYIYLMQHAKGWDKNYFAMPSNTSLEGLAPERLALIYALARQESHFIPSSISSSFALGTMQFMPFLANDIAKQKLKLSKFDQDEMFDDTQAFKFANIHLSYLQKYLPHPLFIAYAYNGGIGFTRRMLAKEHMFKAGEFEPFLSMELVPYSESRIYGKKVLANYIIYMRLIGANIKTETLLQSLISQ
ncbi:transglycosylase SLT domain-containing protein [Campylobacter sp. 19-13652]|uniref:transglycosylase SLT domain-containing protein n=1 Tax=Campylobacter sp. 19-13652 TaxID=2840180 RepID=UPI001C754E70|nr:transglycosylase SLT domain-containing protein [Campylobacter sp. 19-13652]BCX79036.1 transglycosylase [Campylobacter sp. 19-13652]